VPYLPKCWCREKIAGRKQSFSLNLAMQPCEKTAKRKQAARVGRKRSKKPGGLWKAVTVRIIVSLPFVSTSTP